MLLIVNLEFSELSENGIGNLVVHLHFSNSVIWPNLDIRRNESLSTQVGHLIFSEQFSQTKIDNLVTCSEIGINWSTEFLSNFLVLVFVDL